MKKEFGSNLQAEFLRVAKNNLTAIKSYGDRAFLQLEAKDYFSKPNEELNSVAVLMQHISGNLKSRFTEFYTSDGEKPNRNRDAEFLEKPQDVSFLILEWEISWRILFDLLDDLNSKNIETIRVFVRGEEHTVIEAINRQIWHYAFHVGQIVSLCKQIKGSEWKNLSIPKNKSALFNQEFKKKA
jgi:hypothetical protein